MVQEEPVELNLDKQLKEGPIRNRSCTDFLCCLAFVCFWGLSGYIFMLALKNGDLSKIARPYDSDGNACGFVLKNNLTEFKYLYFNLPSVGGNLLSKSICISSCPKASNETVACYPTSNITKCSDIVSYETTDFLSGFCVPTSQELLVKVGSLFSGLNIESFLESVFLNKFILCMAVGVAFALSYMYSVLLEYCTWLIVTISILGIFAAGIFLSILSWRRYKELMSSPPADGQDQYSSNASFYKWVAIVLWIFLSLLLLIIVCLFSRIQLAIHVIMAAADFVTDASGIILVPVLMIVASVMYLGFWIFAGAQIMSTGEVYHNPNYPWGKIKLDEPLK